MWRGRVPPPYWGIRIFQRVTGLESCVSSPIIPRICPKSPRPQNAAAGLVCWSTVTPQQLHLLVAGTSNNVHLLFAGQVNELDGIAGNTDGEVGIFRFLRVFHRVFQFFDSKDIYI